ncbi:Fe-S cluster assembly ATPase SufC [Candidatus Peregrinibacteria bacterium RIFOXYC2_FULL_33_13]|nr:MAG: Fe-S cluster assembly ATP-binding protein SufC [Candidatus Peregrinibacteria bacterium GW2011_GWA2_33_10]KKP40890.1 MAG: ABC transporter ATPase, Fe-S cluster assembly ATP-binding protein [Candidatus Peregrinibacteria bacterium GW2011_GWC2_33_13]OGJ53404.1 MAG: Fe-S cluster assembly ATPase SufC [Candidatus Peregrinibacteria bacterium RIFOXYC2_FULL_33_13]
MDKLIIKNLHAKAGGHLILNGVDLEIKSNEITVLMGQNGSGKSTLLNIIMGHPKYEITKGSIYFNDIDVLSLDVSKRAKLGFFLAFQNPVEVSGVSYGNFLRQAKNELLKEENKKNISPREFLNQIKENIEILKMDSSIIGKTVNEGFSGGEKKKAEILQLSYLKPKFALLDEIDSGLDIDALKHVSEAIMYCYKNYKSGVLLVTHYQRILNYIVPDKVYIMAAGKIVREGGKELAEKLEREGYGAVINPVKRG